MQCYITDTTSFFQYIDCVRYIILFKDLIIANGTLREIYKGSMYGVNVWCISLARSTLYSALQKFLDNL